ncbi:hypothetical protein M3J09_006469 [Ascochyta lentis]
MSALAFRCQAKTPSHHLASTLRRLIARMVTSANARIVWRTRSWSR